MTNLRQHACDIFTAGVDAVRGDELMRQSVRLTSDELWLGDFALPRSSFDRVVIVGAGKASGQMAAGLIETLRPEIQGGKLRVLGHVNVPDGCQDALGSLQLASQTCLAEVKLCAARPAGVNEPTQQAIEGTDRILQLAHEAGPRDLVVGLISGGGSALLCRPVQGVSLADKLAVTRLLSSRGADITQLNTVRKHLSEVKGGGLARACQNAPLVTLVLSDVLGDPLDLIASGPTVPDSSTPAEAIAVLTQFDSDKELPESVYRVLKIASQTDQVDNEHDTVDHNTFVVGNNAVAVDAAGIRAESLGYNHVMQSARECEGQAEDVGRRLAEMTIDMLNRDPTFHRQDALITGGEPVVRLVDASERGQGGRNQQLVLAAYVHLLERGLSDQEWKRLTILSGGTDGEDGPTDAAGAILDESVHQRCLAQRLDPKSFLFRNDAYHFFLATDGLLKTGPTGTNVCDLRVALVSPANKCSTAV